MTPYVCLRIFFSFLVILDFTKRFQSCIRELKQIVRITLGAAGFLTKTQSTSLYCSVVGGYKINARNGFKMNEMNECEKWIKGIFLLPCIAKKKLNINSWPFSRYTEFEEQENLFDKYSFLNVSACYPHLIWEMGTSLPPPPRPHKYISKSIHTNRTRCCIISA